MTDQDHPRPRDAWPRGKPRPCLLLDETGRRLAAERIAEARRGIEDKELSNPRWGQNPLFHSTESTNEPTKHRRSSATAASSRSHE